MCRIVICISCVIEVKRDGTDIQTVSDGAKARLNRVDVRITTGMLVLAQKFKACRKFGEDPDVEIKITTSPFW
jgi:hypothetical protein